MIKIPYPIIVEGKYDKITLENVVDALIIKTDGFKIFKDKEKTSLISGLYKKCGGIVLLCDSDNSGNMIRAHLKNILGKDANIINLYTPQIKGREKRKNTPSKEGFLGVEGISKEILENVFSECGIAFCETKKDKKITKADMFFYGLSGKENSNEARKNFMRYLSLPENLSSSALLDVLNTYFTYDEFIEVTNKWQNSQDKS